MLRVVSTEILSTVNCGNLPFKLIDGCQIRWNDEISVNRVQFSNTGGNSTLSCFSSAFAPTSAEFALKSNLDTSCDKKAHDANDMNRNEDLSIRKMGATVCREQLAVNWNTRMFLKGNTRL